MNEALHDDQLMRYIDGEMDDAERRAFETRLEQDDSLRERLEHLKIAVEAVVQAGITSKVRRIHREMMAEIREENKPVISPVRKLVRVSLAIAASVVFLIVVIGGWKLYQLSPEKLYTESFVGYTISTTRGTGASTSTILSQHYAQKNYTALIQDSKHTSLSAQDSLLVGLAYLETNRLPFDIQWLEAVQRGSGPYRQDAEYYLSLAYVRNREYDKALKLMKQIHADTGHLYHTQVSRSLLRKVRLLKWK